MRNVFALVVLAATILATVGAAPLPIARNGAAQAAIILPQAPHPTEQFAAEELQLWVKEISGAVLPMVTADEHDQSLPTRLVLGTAAAQDFGDDLRRLAGSDGCAVRTRGTAIHLFGAIPKGTLNAVYTFLEHNSDIIWPRARHVVFSLDPSLTATRTDILDRPSSTCRGWGFTVAGVKEPDFLWQVRNRNNFGGQNRGPKHEQFGLFQETGGHNFSKMIPAATYWDSRPEFFPVVNGRRTAKAGCLCLSAPGLQAAFTENVLAKIAEAPGLSRFVLGIDDTWQTCECEDCRKSLTLPDGTALPSSDPAFKSTQWYQFVSPIIDQVYQRLGLQVKVYAYFYTAVPPKIKLPDSLCALICPVPKNEKKAIFAQSGQEPFGQDWSRRILEFKAVAKHNMIREYYGCTGAAPRAQEYVAAQDLRFLLDNGITEFTSEVPVDRIDQRFNPMPSAYWDASALTFWTINRLWWNPKQDVDELRRHFLQRTYRAAAPAMTEYHDLLRDLWQQHPSGASYMDSNQKFTKTHIIETGHEQRCRDLLAAAEKQADHPVSLELIRAARANFETGCNHDGRLLSTYAASAGDFAHPAWNTARAHDDFQRIGHPSEDHPGILTMNVLNDNHNLYLRFRTATGKDQDPPERRREQDTWLNDAFISAHLTNGDKKIHRTIAFDPSGNYVDAERLDRAWNAGLTIITRTIPDGCEAILTIPLAALDFTFGADPLNRLYGNFHCRRRPDGDTTAFADFSWGGRRVGVLRFYGEIYLAKE